MQTTTDALKTHVAVHVSVSTHEVALPPCLALPGRAAYRRFGSGCYVDDGSRMLPNWLGYAGGVGECYALARAAGYKLYALQVSNECWGGNDRARAVRLGNSTACTQKSPNGDDAGGPWANRMFEIGEARSDACMRRPRPAKQACSLCFRGSQRGRSFRSAPLACMRESMHCHPSNTHGAAARCLLHSRNPLQGKASNWTSHSRMRSVQSRHRDWMGRTERPPRC